MDGLDDFCGSFRVPAGGGGVLNSPVLLILFVAETGGVHAMEDRDRRHAV